MMDERLRQLKFALNLVALDLGKSFVKGGLKEISQSSKAAVKSQEISKLVTLLLQGATLLQLKKPIQALLALGLTKIEILSAVTGHPLYREASPVDNGLQAIKHVFKGWL
ncbi:hypothetical protein ACFQ5M_13150 [Agrilactobacillus yilanensis]|uniref:Uncharacterized protein n=1 Tax=Agrilactobacillus yilanensis TaxID=2485997 RepID=A0ABW4JCX9_9LACO|nr:hypothetical protein [Agrilactobacillus yilanensis]